MGTGDQLYNRISMHLDAPHPTPYSHPQPNIDTKMNSHRKQLVDICHHQWNIPLNDCRYYKKSWNVKYTYYKAGKQSQMTFVLHHYMDAIILQNLKF